MVAGRPPKFKTVKELQEAIDWYFFDAAYNSCGIPRMSPRPITISGMAYYLGFESRRSITDYKKKDKFSPTIKKARLRIEQYLEERLLGQAVTGIIFNLKNNFGWEDVKRKEITGKDGNPIETKSTLEAGPGLSGVLQALSRATTTEKDPSDEGGNKE